MFKFQKVKRFINDNEVLMPIRSTLFSAGYDFFVAEDTIIPSHFYQLNALKNFADTHQPLYLNEIAAITKQSKVKPTLVSTGVKCYMPEDKYLQLSVRSSLPLKHWLIMGNGVGIIDSDYADNLDNEGEIFFQLVNLSPFDIILKKGDKIGQGILLPYSITDDDNAEGIREGGFGSTSK